MRPYSKITSVILCLCAQALFASTAHAAIAVTVQDPGDNPFSGSAWTLGFEFSPNTDIDVTSLGFFDLDGNGLGSSHEVALWDNAGNLLASTFVDNSDPLVGFFRFRSIATVQLTAGNNYVIAGHDYVTDPAIREDQNVISTIDPLIAILDGRWSFPSASIQLPPNGYGDPGLYFNTVSFEFTAVPEPAAVCLVAFGLLCLKRFRRV